MMFHDCRLRYTVSKNGICVISATTISPGYSSARRCAPGEAGALRDPDLPPETLLEPEMFSLTATWKNLQTFVACASP